MPEWYLRNFTITLLHDQIPWTEYLKGWISANVSKAKSKPEDEFSPSKKEPRQTNFLRRLTAGAVAGAISRTIVAPFDYARGHFHRNNRKYNVIDAFQYISKSKNRGVRRFFRGNLLTLVALVPQVAIQFAVHDHCKILFDVEHNRAIARRMLAGSIAGIAGQTVVYPLEVIRIRLVGLDPEKRSFVYVCKTVWGEAKWKSFYRGFFANILTVIPLASVTFFIYDSFKRKARDWDLELTGKLRVIFGMVAGWFGQLASTPFHTVRRQMQFTPYGTLKFRNTWITFLYMLREDSRGQTRLKGAFNIGINSFRGPMVVGLSFAIYDYMLLLLKVNSFV